MSVSTNPIYYPSAKRTFSQALGPNLTGGVSGIIGLSSLLSNETLSSPNITGNLGLSGSAGILWANLSTGNFDMHNSSGTFSTGTGTVSLNGATFTPRNTLDDGSGNMTLTGILNSFTIFDYSLVDTTTSQGGGNPLFSFHTSKTQSSNPSQLRWNLGFTGNETGSNVGSDFAIWGYTDAGGFLNNPLVITRSTGIVNLINGTAVTGTSSINSTTSNTTAIGNTGTTTILGNALNLNNSGSGTTNIGTSTGAVNIGNATSNTTISGLFKSYNNITTAGLGIPIIVANNYLTAQTSVQTAVTYVVPSTETEYQININLDITAFTSGSIGVNVAYTTINSSSINSPIPIWTGSGWVSTINSTTSGNLCSTVSIRAKASSTIFIGTVGTFSATYTFSARLVQIAVSGA